MSLWAAAGVFLCIPAGTSHGQLTFADVGAAHGIGPYSMALGPVGGIAAADYDRDGDKLTISLEGSDGKSQAFAFSLAK